jgi:tetratricopeptide repeat protein 8
MALSCMEKSLAMAGDDNMADVWFNIGQIAIGIGDPSLAYQAFKIAVSVDSNHAESYCNLGVLDLRKQDLDSAQSMFQTSNNLAPFLYEPSYNAALLAYKRGNLESAYDNVKQALSVYPGHRESGELKSEIQGVLFGMR